MIGTDGKVVMFYDQKIWSWLYLIFFYFFLPTSSVMIFFSAVLIPTCFETVGVVRSTEPLTAGALHSELVL